MGKVSFAQLLFLFGILAAFSLFTSLAIAKWQYEKKATQKRKEAAEAKRLANP